MSYDVRAELARFGLDAIDPAQTLRKALGTGAEFAELFFEDRDQTQLLWEASRLDRTIEGRDRGVGLRILSRGKSVYGYTTQLQQKSLDALAEDLAAAIADASPPRAPRADWWAPLLNLQRAPVVKRSPRDVPLSEKLEVLKRIENGVRTVIATPRQVTASYSDFLRKILIVNSEGRVSADEMIQVQLYVEVVGEKDGRIETAYQSRGGQEGFEFFERERPEDIGAKAARTVQTLLSARPAPSGTLAVVIAAEAGGTMIHEAVGHGLEADLACNGLSVYQGKVGQSVASPLVTVIDDGSMPMKRGSFAVDDEGQPSQRNVLVENGILKGYMVDRLSAMKFDLEPTGNGRRQTFRHRPMVRMTNTYIASGKDDPQSIVRDTKLGVYVKQMGGGSVDTVTGDFVFAVNEGYWIRDGKIGEPIRGATLVGNGPKVLQSIDRLGSDLGFINGTCGKDGQGAPVTDAQPTLRIRELTVGGEVPLAEYWKE
jgi:TldD protein